MFLCYRYFSPLQVKNKPHVQFSASLLSIFVPLQYSDIQYSPVQLSNILPSSCLMSCHPPDQYSGMNLSHILLSSCLHSVVLLSNILSYSGQFSGFVLSNIVSSSELLFNCNFIPYSGALVSNILLSYCPIFVLLSN